MTIYFLDYNLMSPQQRRFSAIHITELIELIISGGCLGKK